MATFPTRVDGQIIDSTWFNPLQDTVAAVSETIFYAEDFVSIQAAIDAANTAGGGTVLIGPGTHSVELTIFSNIHLRGVGEDATILQLPNGTNGSAVITSDGFAALEGTDTPDGGLVNFSISNLTADGNKANNTAGRGIQLYGANFRLRDLTIRNCAGAGLYSEYANGGSTGSGSASAFASMVKVIQCDSHGIQWFGPHDSNLNQMTSAQNAGNGFWIGSRGNGTQVINSHSWGSGQDYAFRVDTAQVELISCQAEGAALAQVLVSAASFHMFAGTVYAAGTNPNQVGFELAAGANGTQLYTTVRFLDGEVIKWGAGSSTSHTLRIQYHNVLGPLESGIRPTGADIEILTNTDASLIAKRISEFLLRDDFMTGDATNAGVGELGWALIGGGNTQLRAGESGHPGIVRRLTGATSGTYASLMLSNVIGSDGPLLVSEQFEMTFVLRPNNTGADVDYRIGLTGVPVNNPPTNGIYFERLAADTNWFVVTRASDVQTRTDTGVAISNAAFASFHIRRIDASTIGFRLDSGTEITHTTNIPSGVTLNIFAAVNNNVAATRTFDLDYFSLLVAGLSR